MYITSLLLRLSWQGSLSLLRTWWMHRISPGTAFNSHQTPGPSSLHHPANEVLHEGFEGLRINQRQPTGQGIHHDAQNSRDEARNALDTNAQCSHWISECDCVLKSIGFVHQSDLYIVLEMCNLLSASICVKHVRFMRIVSHYNGVI